MAAEATVVIDEDAFDLGWSAGVTGKHRDERPFPIGHPLSYSWISGFIEGKAEREQSKEENRPIRLPRARP
jgi:ribosome modulation factor